MTILGCFQARSIATAQWKASIVIVTTASVSMVMERTARDTRVAKDTDKYYGAQIK